MISPGLVTGAQSMCWSPWLENSCTSFLHSLPPYDPDCCAHMWWPIPSFWQVCDTQIPRQIHFDLYWPVRDFILFVKLVGRMGPFRLLSASYSKAVWLCPCDEVNSPGVWELNLLSGWNRAVVLYLWTILEQSLLSALLLLLVTVGR